MLFSENPHVNVYYSRTLKGMGWGGLAGSLAIPMGSLAIPMGGLAVSMGSLAVSMGSLAIPMGSLARIVPGRGTILSPFGWICNPAIVNIRISNRCQ